MYTLVTKKFFYQMGLCVLLILFSECGVALIGQKVDHPVSLVDIMIRRDSVLITPDKLKALLPKAQDGAVFLIKDGTYSNVILDLSKNNNRAVIIKPQSPKGVMFTGRSSIRILNTQKLALTGFQFTDTKVRNTVVLNNCQEVEVSDNYFEKCGNHEFGNIIRIENRSSNNNIYRNTFEANESMGVVIVAKTEDAVQCVNNFIHHNHFYRILGVGKIYPKKTNGLEAIQLGQGVTSAKLKLYTHIYDNLFEDIVGDGLEIISIKSSNNYVYDNTFLNNRSGITLRFGDNNEVYDNYLENTTQGIRIHGYGHVIKNNYIRDARVGIQLPASHFKNNEQATSPSGYFQQEKVDISDNIIENPTSAAFVIGNGRSTNAKRTLMPRDVSIVANKIIINDTTAKEFETINEEATSELRLNRNERISDKTSAASIRQVRNSLRRQYTRSDSRVGSTWRRPK